MNYALQTGDNAGVAQKRYWAGRMDREPYLIRARRCAALTIPSLYRQIGENGSTDQNVPWQSKGAHCVNTLTSKLTLSIFPPGLSFIRLSAAQSTINQLQEIKDPDQRGSLKQAISMGLATAEQAFADGIAEDGDNFNSTHKHLLVGGTHGIQVYRDSTIREIPLDSFITWRDPQGSLLEFVIEDGFAFETLPQNVRDWLKDRGYEPAKGEYQLGRQGYGKAGELCQYTHGRLEDGKWEVYQEMLGVKIPNTEWKWDKDALPYFFIPFKLLPKEHYGRSYVEDYEGDLQTLDGQEEVITEGTAAAALLLRLVRPGGVTSKDALAKARNGAVITGDANDVATLETNKNGDFNALAQRMAIIEARLDRAFLLNSSTTRNAERVTAQEVRLMAQELQDTIGDVYTGLIPNEQRPYAMLKLASYQRTGRIPKFPKGSVNVKVITGAAALSRNAELAGLDALTMPPNPVMQQAAARVINPVLYFQRRATSLGVDQEGLVLTEEQLKAQDAQAAQQAQMQQATGPMINQGGALLKQMAQQGHEQQMATQEQQAAQQAAQNQPQGAAA